MKSITPVVLMCFFALNVVLTQSVPTPRPASAAVAEAPVMICTVYKVKNWVVGYYDNWLPDLRKFEGMGFQAPYDTYLIDNYLPRCIEEFDGEYPEVNGPYTRVLCAPAQWGPPGTPTCQGK